jgi:hypothetical protein
MSSDFQIKLSAIASEQFNTYRHFHETAAPLRNQIKRYWNEIGQPFPGVGTAWSAVFISWCVFKAGASAQEFRFSPQHSVFVHWAIGQALSPDALFKGRNLTSYAPKVGDILQNNRDGNSLTFADATVQSDYKSHSTIVVAEGTDAQGRYLLTIGGNEDDTVGRRLVRLSANGKIKQPTPQYYISIIETLK